MQNCVPIKICVFFPLLFGAYTQRKAEGAREALQVLGQTNANEWTCVNSHKSWAHMVSGISWFPYHRALSGTSLRPLTSPGFSNPGQGKVLPQIYKNTTYFPFFFFLFTLFLLHSPKPETLLCWLISAMQEFLQRLKLSGHSTKTLACWGCSASDPHSHVVRDSNNPETLRAWRHKLDKENISVFIKRGD